MFFGRNFVPQDPSGGGGFQAPPPSSRPPTKNYDRQSFVLVVDESDDVLKFMKMHLNRFFSHVVVAKSAADGIAFLKQKEFDLVITDAQPHKKSNLELLKKIASAYRRVPVVLLHERGAETHAADWYQPILVVGVVEKPVDLDPFHVAIRRALNLGPHLRDLDGQLSSRIGIGQAVYHPEPAMKLNERATQLIEKIREKMREEFLD